MEVTENMDRAAEQYAQVAYTAANLGHLPAVPDESAAYAILAAIGLYPTPQRANSLRELIRGYNVASAADSAVRI